MTSATKDEYKTMTGNMRVKITDQASHLQGIIDNPPEDFTTALGLDVTTCNDMLASLNDIDAKIDNEPLE